MSGRLRIAVARALAPRVGSTREVEAFEQAASELLGGGSAVAFFKGRVALYTILRALGVGPEDEVILPGYTCVAVPAAVIYARAKPVYADVNMEWYGVNPAQVESLITPRTKALVVQHTYGYPGPVKELKALADRHGLALIEDGCHTFGGKLDGQCLGTFGAAGFFSAQWNKTFTTGLGGLAVISDSRLADEVRRLAAGFQNVSSRTARMLAAQLVAHEVLVFPSINGFVTRLFRWLVARGWAIGSSSVADFEPVMPAGFTSRPSPVQAQIGLLELERSSLNLGHRKQLSQRYRQELNRLGYRLPEVPAAWDLVLVRFPLRVANKAVVLRRAPAAGIEIGSWFEAPLHPVETQHEKFHYCCGQCPVAERLCQETINLPLHSRVSERVFQKTLRFIAEVGRVAEG